jgi:hypothetical protein
MLISELIALGIEPHIAPILNGGSAVLGIDEHESFRGQAVLLIDTHLANEPTCPQDWNTNVATYKVQDSLDCTTISLHVY